MAQNPRKAPSYDPGRFERHQAAAIARNREDRHSTASRARPDGDITPRSRTESRSAASNNSQSRNNAQTQSRKRPSLLKRILCCAPDIEYVKDERAASSYRSEAREQKSFSQTKSEKPPRPTTKDAKWIYNADTPKEHFPFTNWREYNDAYRNRLIDIENPPMPPEVNELKRQRTLEVKREQGKPEELSAYEQQVYLAPKGDHELRRQMAVDRLDLWGKHGPPASASIKPSNYILPSNGVTAEEDSLLVEEGDLELTKDAEYVSPTLEGHPAFKKIVTYARNTFGARTSMITVIDDDQLIYLAETGTGMRSMPRDINFCGHTLLASERGLVALDLSKDWRFANNPVTKGMGAAFYAGVPLFAPALTDEEMPEAIGTLCIVDDKPRVSFSEEERRKLQRLGELARKEVANWHRLRMAQKNQLMQKQLSTFKHKAETKKANPTARISPRSPPRSPKSKSPALLQEENPAFSLLPGQISLPNSHTTPAVGKELNYWEMEDVDEEDERMSEAESELALSEESVTDHSNTDTFRLAARMIAKTLGLPLVYIIALNLSEDGRTAKSLDLLAASGLPNPTPTFDPTLHEKALHAPEGGLLYQNPNAPDLTEEIFPSSGDVEYASAILVSIAEVGRRGYVLASFARDPKRVFGLEDYDYLREIGGELEYFAKRDAQELASI